MPWNETTKTRFARPRDRFGSDLTDEEWNLVEPCLPPQARRGRPRKTDLREVSDAIQHVLATGCQWRALPPCFPAAATVQQYFHLWSREGIFARMMDKFRALGRKLAGRSATPTAAAIDTQSAETTESGGPSGCDAGKKAEGRKRHLVVDVEGLPLGLAVHAASMQDRDGAPAVILGVLEKAPRIKKIWPDGGYQGGKLASALTKLGIGSDLEIVKKTQGCQGVHGSPSPPGRGADLRLDVALPASGEGLRAELGELLGVGAAGRVPLHDAPDRKGRNMLTIKNKIGFMNFRSYS